MWEFHDVWWFYVNIGARPLRSGQISDPSKIRKSDVYYFLSSPSSSSFSTWFTKHTHTVLRLRLRLLLPLLHPVSHKHKHTLDITFFDSLFLSHTHLCVFFILCIYIISGKQKRARGNAVNLDSPPISCDSSTKKCTPKIGSPPAETTALHPLPPLVTFTTAPPSPPADSLTALSSDVFPGSSYPSLFDANASYSSPHFSTSPAWSSTWGLFNSTPFPVQLDHQWLSAQSTGVQSCTLSSGMKWMLIIRLLMRLVICKVFPNVILIPLLLGSCSHFELLLFLIYSSSL